MMRLKRLTALALALMLALSSAALAQADGVAIDSLDKTTYDGLVESALGTQTDETAGDAGAVITPGGEVLTKTSTFVRSGEVQIYESTEELTLLSDAAAEQTIDLPQYGCAVLTAAEADAYQWQMKIPGTESWVNVAGETSAAFTLTYAKVSSMLDSDVARVRCAVVSGGVSAFSATVAATVAYGSVTGADGSGLQPASLMALSSPANTGVMMLGAGDETQTQSTYTIEIKYVSASGVTQATSWTAQLSAGSSIHQTVTFPTIVGYAPYVGDTQQNSYEVNVTNIAADQTITVVYKPIEVNYAVKYYQQNVADDGYTLVDTVTKQGYTDSYVPDTGLANTYEGFTQLWYERPVIAADGSTVVEIYYDRNYYLMTFQLDGGYGVDPIYARFGTPVSLGTPTRAGYTFSGWNPTLPETVPAENLTFKALWTAQSTTFTVVFWYENADNANYSFAGSTTISNVVAGVSVSSSSYQNTIFTGRDNSHFSYNAERVETVSVAGDGSTVLNVYFTRNVYTLTFYDRNTVVATIKAKYDAKIADEFAKAPFTTTYDGRAWEDNSGKVFEYALQTLDRMPGQNVSFDLYKRSSKTLKAIYYYVQKVGSTVSPTKWPQEPGTDYELLKKVNTYFTYATYEEEYHPIEGFDRFDATEAGFRNNQKDFTNKALNLYYIRKSFTLSFYNYNSSVEGKGGSVKYEASLSKYNFTPDYPSDVEEGAYEFDGWYTTSDCYTGSEVEWDTLTMPAANVTLYAKWVPVTHTVNVYNSYDAATGSYGAQIGTTLTVPHGSVVPELQRPGTPTNGNWTFIGWFYLDGGVEKAFDFANMPIHMDMNIYAKWGSKDPVKYTIHYKVKGTDTVIGDDLTGQALAGVTKTFEAKTGEALNAGYQTGYFPETASHSITMDINGGNEYTFYYDPMTNVPYTVHYYKVGTTETVAPDKVVTDNTNAIVTESFAAAGGYLPDAYQKRLVLTSNPAENVLIFWYTADTTHALYKITHYTQNVAGDEYAEYASSVATGDIGQTYSADPLSIQGFTFNPTKSNLSGALTGSGLELKLYYDRSMYPYQVNYLESGTDNVLTTAKKGTARYQAQITEDAVSISGYTVDQAQKSIASIAAETAPVSNVITFYYTENEATLRYQIVGPDGCGTLSSAQESVKVKSGTAQGSTATANANFKFVGWFTDAACMTPAAAAWVTESKLTPSKGTDELFADATYYAKFEYNLTTLTIKKAGWSAADPNQSFLFKVEGFGIPEGGLKVTVTGNGSVTVSGLTVGQTYTITEESGWSWRYTPPTGAPTITLAADAAQNTVTITNTRAKDQWLDGSAPAKENVAGTAQ